MKQNLEIISPDCFKDFPVVCGITTRKGGVSTNSYSSLNMGFNSGDEKNNVIKNREILYSHLDVKENDFVFANQIHSDQILHVNDSHRGAGVKSSEYAINGVDAMVTHLSGIYLTIQTADCMSIFIYCPDKKVVALIHAGWKGSNLNITGKTIEFMIENYFCLPENLKIYLGPCISPEYYEVGEEFLDYFSKDVIYERQGNYYLDLNKSNFENCINAGVDRRNIFSDNYCTFRDEKLFFSYRRDGKKTGRMLSFFALK